MYVDNNLQRAYPHCYMWRNILRQQYRCHHLYCCALPTCVSSNEAGTPPVPADKAFPGVYMAFTAPLPVTSHPTAQQPPVRTLACAPAPPNSPPSQSSNPPHSSPQCLAQNAAYACLRKPVPPHCHLTHHCAAAATVRRSSQHMLACTPAPQSRPPSLSPPNPL